MTQADTQHDAPAVEQGLVVRRPVPSLGIHYGLPNEEYHTWDALSHSWLNRLRITPAHLLDLIENGGEESSPSQVVGSAVHCAVLEREQFAFRYAIRDENVPGTTREGKDFKARNDAGGLITLAFRDGCLVEAIARRARHNKRLHEWLSRPHACEVSVVWDRDGYKCKLRADLLVPGPNIVVDLKTSITASERGFAAQVARYGYHNQAAWYLDGLQRATGETWDWWFIVCEKRRPYLVNCQAMPRDSEAHTKATTENDDLFRIYRSCMESGRWPGYPDVTEIKLPEWAIDASAADADEESFD